MQFKANSVLLGARSSLTVTVTVSEPVKSLAGRYDKLSSVRLTSVGEPDIISSPGDDATDAAAAAVTALKGARVLCTVFRVLTDKREVVRKVEMRAVAVCVAAGKTAFTENTVSVSSKAANGAMLTTG